MVNLDVEEFAQKINDHGVILLDVRTPAEFAEAHLANAVNIDVLSEYFTADIAGLDKNAEYAIYCRSGKRSVDAATAMEDLGYKTSNLTGGVISWIDAGKKVIC